VQNDDVPGIWHLVAPARTYVSEGHIAPDLQRDILRGFLGYCGDMIQYGRGILQHTPRRGDMNACPSEPP
jgi:hypothetical protein